MSMPIDSALAASGEINSNSDQWKRLARQIDLPENETTSEPARELAAFFEEVAPQAKRFAMSMIHRWCEAEEIVQEAFLRMARVMHQPAPDNTTVTTVRSRKSYLFTTIRNLAIDSLRKSDRRNLETREMDTLSGSRDSYQQEQKLLQLESAVTAIMESIQSPWSDALKLKINAELSYAEIAEVLQATTDQVRGWIFRGRKQLAAELKQQGLLDNKS